MNVCADTNNASVYMLVTYRCVYVPLCGMCHCVYGVYVPLCGMRGCVMNVLHNIALVSATMSFPNTNIPFQHFPRTCILKTRNNSLYSIFS
jgi:hypothetical protein